MKKIALICLCLAISATLFAQENKDGKLQGDVLYLNNGTMLRKGSILKLNGPLGDNSHFKYTHLAPDNLLGDVTATFNNPAQPYYAGKEVTVRKIRYVGNKKTNDGKWVLRFRTTDKTDFICDIVPALNSGEISPMQVSVITPQATTTQEAVTPQTSSAKAMPQTPLPENKATTSTFSIADELLKLKKLMDEGIITKEEFEAQKKKLLEM